MKASDLPFPDRIKEILPKIELNEPQRLAIKAGLLEGKSIVVASPTASGKTFIAEMAFLKNFLKNGKSVYVAPLKALASEKYHEFSERYKSLGIKIAISIGDYDSTEEWLGRYDVIITTSEKFDSIIRHNAPWINKISLLIVDEIHLLNDAGRGPTLEVIITRLIKETKAQVLALSATIKNSDEIAGWLGAKLVKSDYRPVKLHKGVFYHDSNENILDIRDNIIKMKDGEAEKVLGHDTIQKNKQALLFVSTRRSAEAVAERLAKSVSASNPVLSKLSRDIEKALPSPTKQCRRLALCVRNGTAFHHAGLVAKQRKIIEDAFRSGEIKILSATPTLAFGVNTPAYRVIIRDVKRYGAYGPDFIPVLEVHQMFGRAGRPAYDKEGEAIVVAKNLSEAEELKEMYINGEPEPIYSKLSVEPMLRMHTLSLIASEVVRSKGELEGFFSSTFFAHQYGNINEVMEKVESILHQLEEFNFISTEKEGMFAVFKPAFNISNDYKISATKLGKKVSELYLDPLSAHTIISSIGAKDEEFMTSLNTCGEMHPLLSIRKKDDFIEEELMKSGIKTPDVWEYEYGIFLSAFKTWMMFRDWMDEAGEDILLEKYGVTPGELYAKTKNAEWMLYSAAELARLLRKLDAANDFRRLQLRIKHGVKEELLRLIKLKGIGRVRARMLFKNGIKTPADIKKVRPEILSELVGKKIAAKIVAEAEESRLEKG
ncbi:MAG: DEAD/DEAH box helicase [Candidatus Aenigmarchaeota archaeon]|nr:DEAD/DEAH box helicase [Candidatus Aenigmarchaeota archaeon]MDI6722595.1 DEAD/DEAH box helicase [Candidatus Aenigmarchaeota archaeon]